jgi:hypothetical protein
VNHLARTLFLVLLVALSFGLARAPVPACNVPSNGGFWVRPGQPRAERVVFLAGGLASEDLIAFSANLAASGHSGLLLIDSPCARLNSQFLSQFRPRCIVPVGTFPDGTLELERRLGARVTPVVPWNNDPSPELWRSLFPTAEKVVLCPRAPRRLLLQAACLAGVLRAPLVVTRNVSDRASLRPRLEEWGTRTVYAVGQSDELARDVTHLSVIALKDEEAVAALHLQSLGQGVVDNLVVANPADTQESGTGMSTLAPWVALQRRALLLLTNKDGTNVTGLVAAALQKEDLRQADALILVGDLDAIPMETRPNPISTGKDAEIEMEPLTPSGYEPFTLATGRLFHADPAVVALQLARQRLLKETSSPRRALVISNPEGNLPLLETFSQNTAQELSNGGYQTTVLLRDDVTPEEVRRLLPDQDIFLCEGHHNLLVRDYHMQEWTEPLRPGLVFLQSCLALRERKVHPFLERGALGVVGSSTRIYSGSGGACSLAFFDALLYEGQSLGASLRHAKNFMVAYALLKEKRLKDATLTGANLRSAWAFSLWGDPTVKLPRPAIRGDALPAARHQVKRNTIIVSFPASPLEKASSSQYRAQMFPNQRLAGLTTRGPDDTHRLVPLFFSEVRLPQVPEDQTPRLRSRLPNNRYSFCWDKRRRCGYLLVLPRSNDREEIHFRVAWENTSIVHQ